MRRRKLLPQFRHPRKDAPDTKLPLVACMHLITTLHTYRVGGALCMHLPDIPQETAAAMEYPTKLLPKEVTCCRHPSVAHASRRALRLSTSRPKG